MIEVKISVIKKMFKWIFLLYNKLCVRIQNDIKTAEENTLPRGDISQKKLHFCHEYFKYMDDSCIKFRPHKVYIGNCRCLVSMFYIKDGIFEFENVLSANMCTRYFWLELNQMEEIITCISGDKGSIILLRLTQSYCSLIANVLEIRKGSFKFDVTTRKYRYIAIIWVETHAEMRERIVNICGRNNIHREVEEDELTELYSAQHESILQMDWLNPIAKLNYRMGIDNLL